MYDRVALTDGRQTASSTFGYSVPNYRYQSDIQGFLTVVTTSQNMANYIDPTIQTFYNFIPEVSCFATNPVVPVQVCRKKAPLQNPQFLCKAITNPTSQMLQVELWLGWASYDAEPPQLNYNTSNNTGNTNSQNNNSTDNNGGGIPVNNPPISSIPISSGNTSPLPSGTNGNNSPNQVVNNGNSNSITSNVPSFTSKNDGIINLRPIDPIIFVTTAQKLKDIHNHTKVSEKFILSL
ncbi:3389_t:CDS:2 [Ambispora leptoticha]|uniref:3389_t:CDS:1 n=1 Tax=Ambispora leptoticha TaxID=144679 RepID=A0A9N9A4U7_9GLOM|nr:3389_t:CDS:2 [Ambispora leptoticha]